MKNSFTLKEKILLALYQGTDEKALTYRPFAYLKRLFPQVSSGSLRVLSNVLVEKASIDKIERTGKVLLGITDIGKKEIVGKPKTMQKWNKEIHMAILSVPEKKREIRHKIRTILTNNNYCLLQPGIWFSPVKNEELLRQLKEEKLLEYVITLEASNLVIPPTGLSLRGVPSSSRDDVAIYSSTDEIATATSWPRNDKEKNVARNDIGIKELVISAWGLDKLQKSYEKYLSEGSALQKMTHFDTSRYINLFNLQEFLLMTVRNDPFFSDEFMPLLQLRKRAWNIFQILLHKKML